MHRIRIITDSASDFDATGLDHVTVLPMTVTFGEESYQDGVTISHRAFYEKLIESDELPVTSLVSPYSFEQAFEEAVKAGETVIAITVSGKLSGTYQSAMIAAQGFESGVYVVDSQSAAIGEQVLVRYALELLGEGRTAQEIVAALEAEKSRIHVIALLDTLEYLKRGGRVPKAVAFVGGVLSIKPVVAIREGEVVMLGTARGSRNGNNHLIKEIEKSGGVDFECPICLGYTGLSDALLQKYVRDSRAIWEEHEDCLRISPIGATIGTHAGPDAVAVAFFAKR